MNENLQTIAFLFVLPAFVLIRYRHAIRAGTLCREPSPEPEREVTPPFPFRAVAVGTLKLIGGGLIVGLILATVAFVGIGALGLLLFGVRSIRG